MALEFPEAEAFKAIVSPEAFRRAGARIVAKDDLFLPSDQFKKRLPNQSDWYDKVYDVVVGQGDIAKFELFKSLIERLPVADRGPIAAYFGNRDKQSIERFKELVQLTPIRLQLPVDEAVAKITSEVTEGYKSGQKRFVLSEDYSDEALLKASQILKESSLETCTEFEEDQHGVVDHYLNAETTGQRRVAELNEMVDRNIKSGMRSLDLDGKSGVIVISGAQSDDIAQRILNKLQTDQNITPTLEYKNEMGSGKYIRITISRKPAADNYKRPVVQQADVSVGQTKDEETIGKPKPKVEREIPEIERLINAIGQADFPADGYKRLQELMDGDELKRMVRVAVQGGHDDEALAFLAKLNRISASFNSTIYAEYIAKLHSNVEGLTGGGILSEELSRGLPDLQKPRM